MLTHMDRMRERGAHFDEIECDVSHIGYFWREFLLFQLFPSPPMPHQIYKLFFLLDYHGTSQDLDLLPVGSVMGIGADILKRSIREFNFFSIYFFHLAIMMMMMVMVLNIIQQLR